MLFSHTTANGAFFSEKMEKFIRDGKETSVVLDEGIDEIKISPVNDTRIYGIYNEIFVDLQGGKYYIFKSEKKQIEYYKIQVFATRERDKADEIYLEVIQSGYQDVRIVEEDGIYKLRLGKFNSKDSISETLDELYGQGWTPWIVKVTEQLNEKIYIYDDNGDELLSGSKFTYRGSFRLDENIYSGTTYFDLIQGKITITHITSLDNLVGGIMESIFKGVDPGLSEKQVSESIKAFSIILRTNILFNSINSNKPITNSFYKGLAEDEEIINNVRATNGVILGSEKDNGELLISEISNLELSLFINNKNGNEIIRNYDYKTILSELFADIEIVDLYEISKKSIMVDAEIEWGLRYKEIRYLSWLGPVVYTVIDLDLNSRRFYLEPTLAKGVVPGIDSLDNMVKEKNALVGINGGFFEYTGRPLGLIYKEGIVSEPVKDRTALLLAEDNDLFFERVSWQGYLETRYNRMKLDGVNRKPGNDQIVLFNSFYGERVPLIKSGMVELVVVDNIVQEMNYYNDLLTQGSLIPEKGYIIQAHGSKSRELIKIMPGELIDLKEEFNPDFRQLNVKMAISAGPQLIKDGIVNITAEEEEFQADIAYGRAPRSAVGKTADKHLVFFTIDGRQPGYSIGVTLDELADFMKDYGIIEGMNLDGGNSAHMVIRGFTMNSPSGGRLISNGILIGKMNSLNE